MMMKYAHSFAAFHRRCGESRGSSDISLACETSCQAHQFSDDTAQRFYG